MIFSSLRVGEAPDYGETGLQKAELARTMQGILSIESLRNDQDDGITLPYWKSKEDFRRWRKQEERHRAQMMGKGSGMKNLR